MAIDRIGLAWVLRVAFVLAAVALVGIGVMGSSGGVDDNLVRGAALMLGIQNGIVGVAANAMAGQCIAPKQRHFAIGAMFVFRDLGVIVPSLVRLVVRVGRTDSDLPVVLAVFAGYFALCSLLAGALSRQIQPKPVEGQP